MHITEPPDMEGVFSPPWIYGWEGEKEGFERELYFTEPPD
jgi:hypothetical protein